MTIHLDISVTSTEYKASSRNSEFSLSGPPVCMTVVQNGHTLFLSVAEGEDAFREDPDFHRMKNLGEIRIFDPFDAAAFEPEHAEMVILFFISSAHRHARVGFPSLVREFFELFVDRFVLTLRIAGLNSLPISAQDRFRRAIQKMSSVRAVTIEST